MVYSIQVGVRVLQLAYLQIVAPIPIAMYITPKGEEQLKKWGTQCLVTFLDSNLIKTNANKYVLKYVDNSIYYSGDGFSNTLSDHLVNLTNNKEICNIYSSLIKGKNDNLLTSLEITDLTKNYKSINNLQIPINNIFDNIQINLRDSNNNNYDFNGVLYLMLSLCCKI